MSIGRSAAHKAGGFTLLEVLVVVVLIALASAILVPAMLRASHGPPTDAAAKLTTSLEELSERSLFLGQVTAMRIGDQGYTPLHFDIASGKFVPFKQTALKAVTLPDDLRLDWRADGDNPLTAKLSTGLAQRANSDADDQSGRAATSADDGDANATVNKSLPQIFFLPGGQATSGELTLAKRATDDQQIRLQLDPLGRVTRLKSGELANAKSRPLLLPKNASLYRPSGASQ